MNESINLGKNSAAFKLKWSFYGILPTLTLLVALTGCGPTIKLKPFTSPTSRLYAPDTLRVKAGTKIATPDGVYQAEADEVWHSDRRFRQLETEHLKTFSR